MPSSFMVKRNYANCPLKKRPFSLYNEHSLPPEQEEPEDLSFKRRCLIPSPGSPLPKKSFIPSSASQTVSHSSDVILHSSVPQIKPIVPIPIRPVQLCTFYDHSCRTSPVSPNVETEEASKVNESSSKANDKSENLPSLAEYYLQLFRSTSEAEAKKFERGPRSFSWQTHPYLPPSPQTSPVAQVPFGSSVNVFQGQQAQYETTRLPMYPETSALISPVSTCSSTMSESEEEEGSHPAAVPKRSIRYFCQSCGKSYSTQSGLRKHSELHCSSLNARAFSCKHCSKAYTSVGALKMHIRTHTLPCKCNVCGKAFSRPWLLQGHIRTHTGEKPFECHQCHRSFADRSNLRAHQQTHQRVKKYACSACNKTFSRMSLLNKHSENVCLASKPSPSPVARPAPHPL